MFNRFLHLFILVEDWTGTYWATKFTDFKCQHCKQETQVRKIISLTVFAVTNIFTHTSLSLRSSVCRMSSRDKIYVQDQSKERGVSGGLGLNDERESSPGLSLSLIQQHSKYSHLWNIQEYSLFDDVCFVLCSRKFNSVNTREHCSLFRGQKTHSLLSQLLMSESLCWCMWFNHCMFVFFRP